MSREAGGEKKSVKRNGKRQKGDFEVRILETRYGLRVLIRQGESKVWLGEHHLNILFNALLARVFSSEEAEQ